MNIQIDGANVEQPDLIQGATCELTVAIASLSIGGAERIVLDWAMRIHPNWRVHLIVLRNREKEWPVPSFVRVTRLEDEERMIPLKHLRSIEDQREVQLIQIGKEIAESDNPVCVCHLLRKCERDALAMNGASIVNVLHNAKDGWSEGVEALAGSSQVIAVSDACANDLTANGWDGPVSVIRHIPPRRQFTPDSRYEFRDSWNVPRDAVVIGMIGAVKSQKNYLLALEVFAKFLEKKDAYLVIVGGPVNTSEGRHVWERVVESVHRLGIRSRVAMPGFIPDAARCLPAFDVVLNTSHFEGLSIATLEALQSGVPVVASKVGGQGEIGCDGLTLLENGSSEEEWSQCLLEKLNSKFGVPSWANFPSYRLWTLYGIARPVKPSGKILFVTVNLNSGGAQRSLVNLVKQIKGKVPYGVAVAGSTTTTYFQNDLKKADIEVVRAGSNWNEFTFAENIIRKVCLEQIGTVCFWNVDARVKLLLVKALGFTNVRFVDVSPGDYLVDELDETREFQRLVAFSRSQYFDRIDRFVLKYHGEAPAGCKEKTVVIPNGILPSDKCKTDYTIHNAPRVVVSGRIASSKFILEIMEAMKIVRNSLSEAEVHFFGAAEPFHREYGDLVAEAAGDEIDRHIFFHGVEFEVRDRLPEFDAYVVLGYHQGCPNALMEALSVGMPSIANDDGGTREQLIHEKTGLLVNSTSPQELAEALIRILSDRKLAERLGKTGRKHIVQSFSMDQMSDRYLAILDRRNLFSKVVYWAQTSMYSLKNKIGSLMKLEASEASVEFR